MVETPVAAARVRVPAPVKLAYGAGQMVEGVTTTIVNSFLFFFYTAVLGVSAPLVGAALFVTLFMDACADPLIGSLSDATRSRLGRRLPYMVIGAPLVAITLGLLFSPPVGWGGTMLFAWLVAISLLLRLAISIFNVPFIALGAELSSDYAERSSVVAFRTVFMIVGGVAPVLLAYSVFLSGENGLLRRAGYAPLAWTAAAVLFIGALISIAGVRRFVAGLKVAPMEAGALHERFFAEIAEIFRNPSFRLLFVSSILFYVAQGVASALGVHQNVFVWRLEPQQIQFQSLGYYAGLVFGVPLTPLVARFLEKRALVFVGLWMLVLSQGGLLGLRGLGVYVEAGEAVVWPLTISNFAAGVGVAFAAIAFGSMMADAADEHDALFGARREGLYFAGLGFAGKAATGLGGLFAGLILDGVRFPRHVAEQGLAAAERLPGGMIDAIALFSGPGVAALSLAATMFLFFYRIDQRRHQEILNIIAARRGGDAAG